MARLLIFIATGILLMSGCVSVKKQRERAHGFFREHPEELAEICADKFPVKVEYREGKTLTLLERDTTYLPGDSIPCPETVNPETGKKYVPMVKCPDVATITEKWLRTDSLLQESTARVEQYRLQSERDARLLAVKDFQLKEAEKRAKNRGWVLAGVLAAGVIYFLLKGRRII